jgi:hypothetical protein
LSPFSSPALILRSSCSSSSSFLGVSINPTEVIQLTNWIVSWILPILVYSRHYNVTRVPLFPSLLSTWLYPSNLPYEYSISTYFNLPAVISNHPHSLHSAMYVRQPPKQLQSKSAGPNTRCQVSQFLTKTTTRDQVQVLIHPEEMS